MTSAQSPPERASWGRRAAALLLDGVVLTLLCFVWPLWDRRNQTLYDKLVGTIVVRTR